MISALSGNSSLALLSLFGRPKSQNTADDPAQGNLRPASAANSTLADGRQSASPESLFAALVDQTGMPADLTSQAVSALDRDGNGSLTSAELMQAYQAIAGSGSTSAVAGLVAQIMSQVDADGDGGVTANELASAVQTLSQISSAEEGDMAALRNRIMSGIDADGDGAVSRSEMAQAMGFMDGAAASEFGIESRPETGPRSLYEAIFSLRVNPEGGEASATEREAIAARLRDTLLR